jgi:hypothetical protein
VAFLTSDSLVPTSLINGLGSIAGAILPDHFDAVDCAFAFLTIFLILKFVNSLRPILGE